MFQLLVALTLVLGSPAPTPPAPPLLELGLAHPGGATILLTIDAGGAWRAPDGSAGQLSPEEVARVGAAASTVVLETTRDVPCPGRPELRTMRVPRGEVHWVAACGPLAHPSVHELAALAEALTTHRPPPVLIKVWRHRVGTPQADAQTIALMRTGAWTTHVGRGTLAPDKLAAIIAALDAALIEAPPTPHAPDCRGDFPHHVDVPGRGEVRFIWPCAKASPSLQAALDLLYAAVGQTAP